VPKTDGTCRDILQRREAWWTFVQVDGVEPTNNAAERSLRPGVVWRKGSFGTQSAEGSRFVDSMMTVVATLKQPQRHVLESLTTACEAVLRGEEAPALLPASEQKSQAAA
jgi:transposase